MGLGTDVVTFFHVSNAPVAGKAMTPRSIAEFSKKYPGTNPQIVSALCHRFVTEGFLTPAGTQGNTPIMGECYYAALKLDPKHLQYGMYDFAALGFPHVRDHFAKSVFPLSVTYKQDGEEKKDIGSGFQLEGGCLITAAHCVESGFQVEIEGWDAVANPLVSIHRPQNADIDLAALVFKTPLLPNGPGFRVMEADILEDVLTMGYPPIPGFETVLAAETAKVAALLKSTTGQVLGTHPSYLGRQPLMLISARVKGGNSGGPVINKIGNVVGVVTDHAVAADGTLDSLGYGIVTPGATLKEFLDECMNGKAKAVPFANTKTGFIVN